MMKIWITRLDICLAISPEAGLSYVIGRSLRRGQNRQMQGEHASLPDFALDAHTPAVGRDDMFDQAQSQSVAVNLGSLRLFAAIERLENTLLLGWRDAQSDPTPGAAVFHRVAEQIVYRAAQGGGVGFNHRQARRELAFDLKIAFGHLQAPSRDRAFDNLVQFSRLQFVRFSSRSRAGEFQNLFDHSGQPAAFVAYQSAVAFDLIAVIDHAVSQIFRRRTNYSQRRAQFMRNPGDEFHLLRREPLGAAARKHYEADAHSQQQQNAETDREVA